MLNSDWFITVNKIERLLVNIPEFWFFRMRLFGDFSNTVYDNKLVWLSAEEVLLLNTQIDVVVSHDSNVSSSSKNDLGQQVHIEKK